MKNIILANEKLNKWCNTEGINYHEGIEALGFLFKYAVPRLKDYQLTFEWALGGIICAWTIEECSESVKRNSYHWNTPEDPALALFWCIYSLIDNSPP